MRSNRALGQVAGQYALDMFVGSTLQIDQWGNSSTVTNGRLSGLVVHLTWVQTQQVVVTQLKLGKV